MSMLHNIWNWIVIHPIWKWVKHYAYGCFAKSWNSAITATYAFVAQAAGSGLDPEHFSAPTWRTAAYTFGLVFAIQGLGYFKDNPLPEKLPKTEHPFDPMGLKP